MGYEPSSPSTRQSWAVGEPMSMSSSRAMVWSYSLSGIGKGMVTCPYPGLLFLRIALKIMFATPLEKIKKAVILRMKNHGLAIASFGGFCYGI